jgi:hypothetical protein
MTIEAELEHARRRGLGWLGQLKSRGAPVAREAKRQARAARGGLSLPLTQARGLVRGLGRQPLTVGGIIAGVGIALGAAAVLRGRSSAKSDVPEEIVARALCHEDPDTPTHRGPLWTGYRNDARRVLTALREAGLLAEGA